MGGGIVCYGLKIFGWLKKKTLFLLLSGVLLFFCLCLSSSSYCSNYYITSDNVNEFLNYYGNWYNAPSNATIKSRFNNYLNTYNNSYDNSFIQVYTMSNGKFFFYLYFFNNSNITYARYTSPTNWRIDGTGILRCSPLDNSTYTIDNFVSANTSRGQYFMISNPVGTIESAPFQSTNVMNFITDYFEFIYDVNLLDINIEDFNQIKQVEISDHGHTIAEFGLTTFLDKVTLTYWKYNKTSDYFEPIFVKDVNSYSIINNDLGYLYFTYDQFIPNTIMQFVLASNDLDTFPSISPLFYCVDANTIVDNDGNLDINNTFTDDYYIKYNNLINNILSTSGGMITSPSGDITGYVDLQPIKNSIDGLLDSSEVDNVLGGYMTSGEILGAMNYHTYGDEYHNSYSVPIMLFFDKVNDVLLDSGDVYFDIPLRNGGFKRIYSSDFYVPENGLKQFIRIFMVFSTIFVLYLHFKSIIEDINSGDGLKLLTKEQVDMNIVKM